MARPGGARASLAHGLEAVAATWFGEIWSRAHRLGEGRAAVADAGPDLIHDLRIYVPAVRAVRPAATAARRAPHASRAAQEVAWAMQPLSRARDWDVFTMEVLPQLCDADPDIDPQASAARARARSEIAHDEMYANLQTERFQAMLRLLRERSAEIPAAMAERAPRSLYRALGRRLEGWDALRARLDNAADQGRGASMRRGSASNACAMPARRCCCSVHPASSSATSRPWPTCKARWAARRTSVQPPRWGAMCQPVDRQAGGSTGDKAALRLLRRAGDGLRSASRRLLRRPSFWAQASRGRVARRLGSAGAEAPRATA